MSTMIVELYKALTEAGVSPETAERAAAAVASNTETATRGDLREMEARIEAKIESANANMIKWLAGLLIAQGAAIAALVKML